MWKHIIQVAQHHNQTLLNYTLLDEYMYSFCCSSI